MDWILDSAEGSEPIVSFSSGATLDIVRWRPAHTFAEVVGMDGVEVRLGTGGRCRLGG